jgi:iron complex outermembrane receptor protein
MSYKKTQSGRINVNFVPKQPHARRHARLLLSCAALALSVSANAQESPSAGEANATLADQSVQEGRLEEIVVTAQKRAENLQDTPIAISAFTESQLRERGVVDVGDLGRLTPNATFNRNSDSSGSASIASVFIRGIGQGDYQPTADPGVGVYLDGVYLGRSVGGLLDLVDVERVEVLRGPQGSLFGRNTVGGAVSIITAKPTDDLEGFVQGQIGNDDWYELSGALNLPLSSTVSSRFVARGMSRDGFVRSLSDPAIEFGKQRNLQVRGQVQLEASERATFNLAADYYTQDNTSAPSFPFAFTGVGLISLYNNLVNGKVLPGPRFDVAKDVFPLGNRSRTTKTGPTRDDLENWGVGLTGEIELSDSVTLKSITAYREVSNQSVDDSDGSSANAASLSEQFSQDQLSQEIQLIGTSRKLQWVVGLYYFQEHGTELTDVRLLPGVFSALNALPGAVVPLTPTSRCPGAPPANICAGGPGNPRNFALDIGYQDSNDIRLKNYAVFGQGTLRLTDQLSITLGGRLTYEKKKLNRFQRRQQASEFLGTDQYFLAPIELEDAWTNFSPRISIDYSPSDPFLLYASYTGGFRSGTFNGRSNSVAAATTPVDPETVQSFEAGLKSELLDRRVRANLAGFYNRYKDIQILANQATAGGGFTVFLTNAAKAEIYGAELEVTARPTNQIDLTAALGYLHTEILEVDPVVQAATGLAAGARLRKAPEFTANVAGQYTVPLSAGDLAFRLDYSYRSNQFHAANNSPLTREGGYGLLNGRVAFSSRDELWELAAFGRNLTNKVYYGALFVAGGSIGVAYPQRGREYGLSIRRAF